MVLLGAPILEPETRNLRRTKKSVGASSCSKCRYETEWEFALDHHTKRHQNQIQSWDLFSCDFKIGDLHRETRNLPEYRCELCGLTTFSELFHQKHLDDGCCVASAQHFNKTPLSLEYCPSKPKFVLHLKHRVIGKRNSDNQVEWFKCTICLYKTKAKRNLQRHNRLKHAIFAGDAQWLRCEKCTYRTKNKILFNHHATSHTDFAKNSPECWRNGSRADGVSNDTSEDLVEWFPCSQCSFRSKKQSGVNAHLRLQHSEKVVWFKCEFCTFVTKLSRSLKTHVINKHTSADVIKWFNCDLCPHRAKCHSALMNHKRYKHK